MSNGTEAPAQAAQGKLVPGSAVLRHIAEAMKAPAAHSWPELALAAMAIGLLELALGAAGGYIGVRVIQRRLIRHGLVTQVRKWALRRRRRRPVRLFP